MVSINFPPNSGDLSPIETVWAQLRKDLAVREWKPYFIHSTTLVFFRHTIKQFSSVFRTLRFEDLKNNRVISVTCFKQRVSQLLNSYSLVGPGEKYSYLEKLVRGLPRRLAKCKKNKVARRDR